MKTRLRLERLEDRSLPAAPVVSWLSLPMLALAARRRARGVQARYGVAHSQEQLLLSLTNNLRRGIGLAPLTTDLALVGAARTEAQALAALGGLPVGSSVHSASGWNVSDRARQSGYAWTSVAENVFSSNDRKDVNVLLTRAVQNWLGSPTHRINLLDPAFRDIGFAVARSGDGFLHVVAVFGVR